MLTDQHAPLHHYHSQPLTHPAPVNGAKPTAKRLRSCLSPTRSRPVSPEMYTETPGGSRSTSFSSGTSSETWKRVKSVRWQEMNGCAVTSFHDTYSHEEYDRTPLEPPTSAERACVLPERGSRCLSSSRDCFSDSSESDDEDEAHSSSPPSTDFSAESFLLQTPPPTENSSEDGDAEGERGREGACRDDEGWDECMERRRMMFARLAQQEGSGADDRDRHPEFEGYRSISATLAQLLKSVGCEDEPVGPQADEEEEEEEQEGEEEERRGRGLNIFGLSNLPLARSRDIPEIGTPSLVSTEADSEAEYCIASPSGMAEVCHSVVGVMLAGDLAVGVQVKEVEERRERERDTSLPRLV
ncbi:hypothetical protein IAT38_000995 [Cryptococcus sp. DSM 104549]